MEEALETEKPVESTEKALIMVPGINSGPYGRLFDPVAEFAKSENHQVIRINAWDGPKDLEDKTLKQLHKLINEAAEKLRENGCQEITILGKSFGGQLTLTHPKKQEFAKMILWAPALDIQKEGNIVKWRTTQLKKAEQATDIIISKKQLREITTPTTIIHGEQDQVVPVDASRKLQKHIPECKLKEIEKTGHSYKQKENELFEKTIEEI